MFKPMLAAEAVKGNINYGKNGMVALPKLNGVRGANQAGSMYARSLKPIPNNFTRELFFGPEYANLEGELVVGAFDDEEVFSASTSGVMTLAGKPEVMWHVFDVYHPTMAFIDRLKLAHRIVEDVQHPNMAAVPFRVIHSDDELQIYADEALRQGYEGLVLRDPNATYKEGRSTALEGGFMRFCPWLRSEAIILGIVERMENKNPANKNELGRLMRSSHKANMVGLGRAGAAQCRDLGTGIEFSMTIPTDKLQKIVWDNPEGFLQKPVKYKFKPPVIKNGKPRFPQWEGLRADEDMS